MLAARHLYFSIVLAARKKNLTTARARKNKSTAGSRKCSQRPFDTPMLDSVFQGARLPEVTYQIRDTVFHHISNTEKRVENTTRSGVFLTNFEVFDIVMKDCDECFI